MKKLAILSWAVMAVVALGLSSCKKDGGDEPQGNYLKISDQTKDLAIGRLWTYGANNQYFDGYYCELLLFSLDGTSGIDLALLSTSASDLVPGTYKYTTTERHSAPAFGNGFASININREDAPKLVSGKVVVSKSGSIYTITFSGTNENDEKVTAKYIGALLIEQGQVN